jgi:hypothetical protein
VAALLVNASECTAVAWAAGPKRESTCPQEEKKHFIGKTHHQLSVAANSMVEIQAAKKLAGPASCTQVIAACFPHLRLCL